MADETRELKSLVEAFVEAVNSHPREPKFIDEVPEALRVGPESDGETDWRIVRLSAPRSVAAPMGLPASFRELVENYAFPELDFCGILLEPEFPDKALKDRFLVEPLLRAGYLPFAWPNDGSYDPLYFDAREPWPDNEWPIVRAKHEPVLLHGSVELAAFATSFADLLRQFLRESGP